MELLQQYEWPGNIRELENLMKQIVVRNDEDIISRVVSQRSQKHQAAAAEPLQEFQISDLETGLSLKEATQRVVERTEKDLIHGALNRTNWNRKRAAQLLGISYRSLLYKIKEYGLN